MEFEAILKIDPGPSYGGDDLWSEYPLGFRVRNRDFGYVQFAKSCVGTIRFDEANKTLEGTLEDVRWDLGAVDFKGKRLPGPKRSGELGSEWNYFVEDFFGRRASQRPQ